jgi:hypothetical protein
MSGMVGDGSPSGFWMQTTSVYDGIFKHLSTITVKKPLFAKDF